MKPSLSNPPAYWLFWVILVVMAAVFPVYAWHENTSGFLTDDAMYLLLADFYSPYYEGNHYVHQLVTSQARFPPAFPVFIGLFGGGSNNMQIAHLATCATFLASGAALYAWARRVLDSRQTAVACLLVYALLPKTLVYVIEIWSEFLYMALAFLALLALDTVQRNSRHAREGYYACAAVIGLALLTRTVGIALLAAFIVHVHVHSVSRKYTYILMAVLPAAAWKIVQTILGYGGTYMDDLTRYIPRDGAPTLLLTDIPHNASLLLESWGRHFLVDPGSPLPAHGLALLLLALALIGAARRAADKQADPYYVLFYIVMVMVWPHPDHYTRLLYPVVVPALVYMFIGLAVVTAKASTPVRSGTPAILILAILALMYPNALFVIDRFLAPVPTHIAEDFRHTRQWLQGNDMERVYSEADRRQAVTNLIGRVDEHLAPHECIYAVHPPSAMLYSGRRSIILPEKATIAKLGKCRYVFVMNLAGVFRPLYPLNLIDASRLVLVDRELDNRGHPQAFLFKIRQ